VSPDVTLLIDPDLVVAKVAAPRMVEEEVEEAVEEGVKVPEEEVVEKEEVEGKEEEG
jgi:hypothetical protein